jgi:hypothetical protein
MEHYLSLAKEEGISDDEIGIVGFNIVGLGSRQLNFPLYDLVFQWMNHENSKTDRGNTWRSRFRESNEIL